MGSEQPFKTVLALSACVLFFFNLCYPLVISQKNHLFSGTLWRKRTITCHDIHLPQGGPLKSLAWYCNLSKAVRSWATAVWCAIITCDHSGQILCSSRWITLNCILHTPITYILLNTLHKQIISWLLHFGLEAIHLWSTIVGLYPTKLCQCRH